LKSAALDTSVVLRLLTGVPDEQAQRALTELTERLRAGARVFVSDMVLSEAYFALQHHYNVPKGEALRLLAVFLAESGVTPTGSAASVLATPHLATAKPGFVDRLIHADSLRAADELLTFETAARRLPQVCLLTGDR
jgi:predicted nucleic-acid-binding protein